MFVFIVTKYKLSLYCLHTSAQISNAIRTCFNTKRQKVKDFGLKSRPHVLLEGVTFPPEIRATIAQSVGPMTTLISLTKESKDSRYGKKHRDAAARAFAHVPGVETIVKAVEGTKASESAPLIRALGDLSLLVPARTQRRAYFPLAMFAYTALSNEEAQFYAVEYKKGSDAIAKQPTARYTGLDKEIESLKMSDVITPTHHIKCWDVSGKGAMIIYNNAASCVSWTLPKTPEFDVGMMSQSRLPCYLGLFQ